MLPSKGSAIALLVAACGGGSSPTDSQWRDPSCTALGGRTWGPAVRINESPGLDWSASVVRAATMGDDAFVAAWSSLGSVWANRWIDGQWEGEELLSRVASEGPVVAGAAGRHSIVGWTAFDGEAFRVYVTRRESGTWWTEPEVVPGESGEATNPRVAIDAAGNAIVAWSQHTELGWQVFGSRYDVALGWEVAAPRQVADGFAATAEVAAGQAGHALITWAQGHGPNAGFADEVWVQLFDPLTGWAGPEQIDDGRRFRQALTASFRDGDGSVLVAWTAMVDSGPYDQVTVRRHLGARWSQAVALGPVAFLDSRELRLSVQGNWAAIAWAERTGIDDHVARVSIGDPAGAWSSETCSAEGGYATWDARAVVACDGSAATAWPQAGWWREDVYETQLFARGRDPSGAWGPVTRIDGSTGDVRTLDMAASPDGKAVVAWFQTGVDPEGSAAVQVWASVLE